MKSDMRKIILVQNLHRRRLAKKELVALKTEAKSATKFKEISYKLENKVVELTQTLQKRTAERKEFQERVARLEAQLQQLSTKHDDSETRVRDLSSELKKPTVPTSQFEALLAAKQQVDAKMEEALGHIAEQDAEIDRLNDGLAAQHVLAQERQAAFEEARLKNQEDANVIISLQEEVSTLKEQINRANALSALTRNSRAPQQPPSPTVTHLNGSGHRGLDMPPRSPTTRKGRRHSLTYAMLDGDGHRTSADERLIDSKKEAAQLRAISMALPSDGMRNGRDSQGLPIFYEDPGAEIMRMLENTAALEEDVLNGLIMNLKIPTPSLNNPPKFNEVMFPCNLVSLIANEMWKYGLITESENFLANVMQYIQRYIMVSLHLAISLRLTHVTNLSCTCSNFPGKTSSFPDSFGFQISISSYRLWLWLNLICSTGLDLVPKD